MAEIREALAAALEIAVEDLRDDARLEDLVAPLGTAASPDAGGLRPCELGYFLLAADLEDRTGLNMTGHPQFDRLLTGTVGEFLAAMSDASVLVDENSPAAFDPKIGRRG